jgi:hypothetical protein
MVERTSLTPAWRFPASGVISGWSSGFEFARAEPILKFDRRAQEHPFAGAQPGFNFDELVGEFAHFHFPAFRFKAARDKADLLAVVRKHRLHRDVDDVGQLVDEDFHLGTHAGLSPTHARRQWRRW